MSKELGPPLADVFYNEGPHKKCELNNDINDSLYFKIKINGIFVNCLIDTGSTLTVIHVRKFLSIPESQRPDKIYKGVQLKLANGEIITTFGQADFDIEINGQKFQQRFVIADIDAPAIVGYNFLYNKDCKLDIRESKLTIGSKNMEIICQKESNMVNIFKLATEETTVIPPRSEVLVFSKVVGDSTHLVQATVEPVDTKDKLLVARS